MTMRMAGPFLVVSGFVAAAGAAQAPADLVCGLQRGGYVLVMRHAHAPAAAPAKDEADPANITGERQLDPAGKAQARAFGAAITTLRIRFDPVFTSPAFRARETVRIAGLADPEIMATLAMAEQQAMMTAAPNAAGADLRALAARRPAPGANILIVSHLPNMIAAFPNDAATIGDGDAIVLRPGTGSPEMIGRIDAGAWTGLAATPAPARRACSPDGQTGAARS